MREFNRNHWISMLSYGILEWHYDREGNAVNAMSRVKGIGLVVISAVLFGITPIISKLTYAQGSNPMMMSFLRALLSLPFLYAVLKSKNVDLHITKEEAIKVTILGFFGTALTMVMLYLSYNYIAVGTATTLHFTYPALVMVFSVLFLGKRCNKFAVLSLLISVAGVSLFLEKGQAGAIVGVVLALASAGSYAFYILFMDRSGLKNFYAYKLSFYLDLVATISMFLLAGFTGNLTFAITPIGWIYSFIVAVLASVLAISFFQMGVHSIGAVGAGMFSLLEPVTSIIAGYFLLNEMMNGQKILGCVLIFLSLMIYSKAE